MIITIKGAEALINKKEIEAVKEKIEQYYYNEKVLAWNQKELERLTRRLQEIEQDRNSPLLPVSLDTDLQGIRYDRIGGKSGVVQSPIDRNIEAIYDRLDKNYEETQEKILDLKIFSIFNVRFSLVGFLISTPTSFKVSRDFKSSS